MLSTCPSCLTQVDHPDHLFEVACTSCGTNFSPFLTPTDSHETAPSTSALDVSITHATDSFNESASMFQELRDFGEALAEGKEPPPASPTPEPSARAKQTEVPPTVDTASPAAALMTSGELLSGYAIERYLFPLSILVPISATEADPLKAPLEELYRRALSAGANALISLRWAFAPQGEQILLSAVPVVAKPQ